MNFFGNLFKPRSRTSSTLREIYKTLYPESVRYALQYNESRMGKAEMLDLLPNYVYEVVYLMAKAVASNRRKQRQYFYDLVKLYSQANWTEDDLRELLRRWIDLLPEHAAVSGTKLAQLNRYGSDYWLNTFRDLAETMYAEKPDAIPCLIAHTPLFALQHFVRIYRQHPQGKLLILVPDWMEDTSDDLMGYDITLGATPTVGFQEKDDCIFGEWECYKHDCPFHHTYCGNTLFVDDTINTGATAGKLESFWHTEYGLSIPEDRIRVITDLRGRGYVKVKPKQKE